MKGWRRLEMAFKTGEKLPRKIKKTILGKRISKGELRRLLGSVEIVQNRYPSPDTILPYEFCPRCGCELQVHHDHYVEYPEIWVDYHCLRCNVQVASEDNGPYQHVLSDMVKPVQGRLF